MKSILALGLGLLLTACQPAPEPTASSSSSSSANRGQLDRQQIDQTLRQLVEEAGLVGVSALVYQEGEEAYFGAYGMADREAQQTMRRDTLVRLYSMTKPIVGVALMTLYEEGLFQLDDPLANYLPEYSGMRVYRADGENQYQPPTRPITIYDTLRHTAGFIAAADGTPPGQAYLTAAPFDRNNTLAQMSERLSSVPLVADPGTGWLYGPATDVQARLVEVLAGQPLEAVLQERIFDPLQMHDTGYLVPAEKRARMAALYEWTDSGMVRTSDEVGFSDYVQPWPLRRGGTGLVSSLDDYMRFARMLANGGELEGARILQPETVELMATDALPETVQDLSWLPNKGQVGFGINFAVRLAPPASSEEASGAVGEFFWDGYANTLFWVDPANDITAVLFTQYIPFGPVPLHKPFRDAVYRHFPEARAPAP